MTVALSSHSTLGSRHNGDPLFHSATPPVSIGYGITVAIESITPDAAECYLSRNEGNRYARPMHIERLAKKIREGRWLLSHQAIAFDDQGDLIDGQHRLMAIVKAGRPALLIVIRGLRRQSMTCVDENTRRTVADVYGQVGDRRPISKFEAATASVMYMSTTGNSAATCDKEFWIQYINEHYDAIMFASHALNSRGPVCHSAIRGAIARAWYTQDRVRLEEFGAVLNGGGFTDSECDFAAVALRNYYLAEKQRLGGQGGRLSLYRRTVMGLQAFLERKPLKFVREMTREPFRIPGDS